MASRVQGDAEACKKQVLLRFRETVTEFLETVGVGIFLGIRRNVGMDIVLPWAKAAGVATGIDVTSNGNRIGDMAIRCQLPMMGRRKEGRKEGAKQDRPEVVRLS